MPAISLPDPPTYFEVGSFAAPIMATMFYPRLADGEKRQQEIAARAVRLFDRMSEEYTDESIRKTAQVDALRVYGDTIGSLARLSDPPDRMETVNRRARRASLSGKILRYLLRIAKNHPRYRGLDCAKALVQASYEEPRGDGSLEKAPSDSLIEKSWAEFKGASHLWAAFLAYVEVGPQVGAQTPATDQEWVRFLEIAEGYRALAEEYRILSPSETWSAPEGLGLTPVPVGLLPLYDDELSVLETYFP